MRVTSPYSNLYCWLARYVTAAMLEVKNKSISLLWAGNLTLFPRKFFEKKFYFIDPQHGRLVTWLQTKNTVNSKTFGSSTVNLLSYPSHRREPWERGCGTVCTVFIDLILLCFPRQHWIRGGGERFFIWNQCAFSSGQPKNVGIFVMRLNRFCLRTVTL